MSAPNIITFLQNPAPNNEKIPSTLNEIPCLEKKLLPQYGSSVNLTAPNKFLKVKPLSILSSRSFISKTI